MADILFIKPSDASFVVNDERIIRKHFTVESHWFQFGKFTRLLVSEIKLVVWLIRRMKQAKAVYVWFADYHSVIPVLFAAFLGKKSIVVVGGYDVARVPELNYGAHVRPFRSLCVKWTFRKATELLAVSEFVRRELVRYSDRRASHLLYNGVDTQFFQRKAGIGKKEMALTVCGADDERTVRIKGVDLFIDIAYRLPDVRFVVAGLGGAAKAYIERIGRKANIEIRGRSSLKELLRIYNEAKVYCQFSVYESFCMALAEAMLCECIPVVTNSGALPEVVGDAGLVLKSRDADRAAEAVREAMRFNDAQGQRARKRIKENFTLDKRERLLVEVLGKMISSRSGHNDG